MDTKTAGQTAASRPDLAGFLYVAIVLPVWSRRIRRWLESWYGVADGGRQSLVVRGRGWRTNRARSGSGMPWTSRSRCVVGVRVAPHSLLAYGLNGSACRPPPWRAMRLSRACVNRSDPLRRGGVSVAAPRAVISVTPRNAPVGTSRGSHAGPGVLSRNAGPRDTRRVSCAKQPRHSPESRTGPHPCSLGRPVELLGACWLRRGRAPRTGRAVCP